MKVQSVILIFSTVFTLIALILFGYERSYYSNQLNTPFINNPSRNDLQDLSQPNYDSPLNTKHPQDEAHQDSPFSLHEEGTDYEDQEAFDSLLPKKNLRYGNGVFKGATLRGFVEKKGMTPPIYFTPSTKNLREKAFDVFMDLYVEGNRPSIGHSALPYPHCQVYVNHHYKFIWIKGHKVGSTSMRGPLGWLCGDKEAVPAEANFDYCSEPLFEEPDVPVSKIEEWWNEYFVFTFVRNPYIRFSSAQVYVDNMLPEECGRKPSFVQTCLEPNVQSKFCRLEDCCADEVDQYYPQFMDQSSCLFTESLLPAVDFVGEVENMREDFRVVIEEINKRRDESKPTLVIGDKKVGMYGRETVRSSYHHRVFKEHQSCLEMISYRFNRDFLLLGYDKLSRISEDSEGQEGTEEFSIA